MYRSLYVWVEGPDDERFFDSVVRPAFEERYDWVRLVRYANMKQSKARSFLVNIEAMGADYILWADINTEPSVTAKKQRLQDHYGIEGDGVIVVIREIESWYLAGLGDNACGQLRVPPQKSTDTLTKEEFDRLKPQRFGSRIDFMVEILKRFCTGMAKRKNGSFRYFAERYGL